jgi:hypothetical protein
LKELAAKVDEPFQTHYCDLKVAYYLLLQFLILIAQGQQQFVALMIHRSCAYGTEKPFVYAGFKRLKLVLKRKKMSPT